MIVLIYRFSRGQHCLLWKARNKFTPRSGRYFLLRDPSKKKFRVVGAFIFQSENRWQRFKELRVLRNTTFGFFGSINLPNNPSSIKSHLKNTHNGQI